MHSLDACNPQKVRCPQCGRPVRLIRVHGHSQCAHCGFVAIPCCDGMPTDACAIPEDRQKK